MANEPKTLQEAILYFSKPENCRNYLVSRRWPNGVECPHCGSKKVKFSEKHNRWQCSSHHQIPSGAVKPAPRQFTLKTGTIMEESPIGIDKWLLVMWQLVNCKNGVSSYEISKDIGVTQKSAWFMLHRLREVVHPEQDGPKLSGEIEADETFIGGKTTNMHRFSRRKLEAQKNKSNWGKTIVLGLLEREGNVRAAVAPTRQAYHVMSNIASNVEPGSTVYSDEHTAYTELPAEFTHEVINHLQGYVNGKISTNAMENFWSLLKRTLKGTYVSVDPVHLQAYVDEQVFRFNTRKDADDYKRRSNNRPRSAA